MRITSYKLKLLTSYLVHFMLHFAEANNTENKRCQEKILSTYPDAKCSLAKDPDDCKIICEKFGTEKCKDTKGEIKKLHCKNHDVHDYNGNNEKEKHSELMTCCCSITCVDKKETRKLLMEGFDIPRKDSICVESDKGQADIKEKLSKACKADEMVDIVKKYCNEEKKGTYFCLKDGRCVENECIGCVRHQCDIDGKRKDLVPPDTYIEKIKSTHKTIKPSRDPIAKGRSLVINDEDDANSIGDGNEVVKAGKTEYWHNLTSCCQAKKVPGSCLGHCIVDYSNGYRKLSKDEEKTMDMGLCKDHAKAIKECQKRELPLSTEWCTDIQNEKESYSCKDICKQLGNRLCSGHLDHYTYKEQASSDGDEPKKCCCLSKCVESHKSHVTKALVNDMSRKESKKLDKENRTLRKAKHSSEKLEGLDKKEDSLSEENISKNENEKELDSDKDNNKENNNVRTHNVKDKRKEEDTNSSNDNERKSSTGGEDYQLNEKVQKPRKFFRKMSRLPYKDVFGSSTHHTYDKRLPKHAYKDGTEYAGGEYSEELIPGNIHWEEK